MTSSTKAVILIAFAALALPSGTAMANDQPAGQPGSWETRVIGPAGADEMGWVTEVYARRASKIETASLGAGSAAKPHALGGIASYYWQDQMTASGEVFDKRDMTAAHKTLPMGTRVKVTNLKNGRTAVVRINDRGPFTPGRVIDVSEAAADALGMRQAGLTQVKIDVLQQ